jgi:hypothetical protein
MGINVIARIMLTLRLQVKMFKGLIFRHSSRTQKIIFVIGTGRSGTHFLTSCLIGHNQIFDLAGGKENPLVFRAITAAALDHKRASSALSKAKKVYSALASSVSPAWFVDQTHPNIWFAEYWSNIYPAAIFLGIIRNPYSVVASMMKHRGVSAWNFEWGRYPVPNRFLGITTENASRYDKMSLAERCALRWVSHYRRLHQLERSLHGKLSIVIYEDLCEIPQMALSKVAVKLEIEPNFHLPVIDRSAIARGANMSPADMAAIRRVLVDAKVEQRWLSPPW